MKRRNFMEERIISILKEYHAGVSADELCRRHENRGATFCEWSSQYGGMLWLDEMHRWIQGKFDHEGHAFHSGVSNHRGKDAMYIPSIDTAVTTEARETPCGAHGLQF